MTLEKFLLNETSARELCLITSCGYVEQTVFIDHEDLFIHAVKDKEKQVRGWHFGTFPRKGKELRCLADLLR